MYTENCVRCFKPATIWGGHVLSNGVKVIAGWCGHRCQESSGFVGHYAPNMSCTKRRLKGSET